MNQLVLSLFPGADLFGQAFEKEGFCVVKGPELMMGQDIRNFKGIKGKFDGVIGGPPCQVFSKCQPKWFIMEEVASAPICKYATFDKLVDAWAFGAKQRRWRRFSSNLYLDFDKLMLPEDQRDPDPFPTVTATEYKYCGGQTDARRAGRKVGRQLTIEEMNVLMGLPKDFSTPCLLRSHQYMVRGNGVPLEMGVAVAKAVKYALTLEERNVA